MKRFYIAAVAGLCAVGSAGAQEGALAPTVPVVPPPVLQNGSLVAPAGGAWGTSGPRLFARTTWSPVRSPVVAGDMGYTAPAAGYAVPPLPPDVGTATGAPGACGPAGCGHARGGMSWDRLKAWLCYHPSKTELPRMQPAPYVTSTQGLFSCTSGAGCGSGYSAFGSAGPQQPPFAAPPPPMMTPPGGAGAVVMPPRGTQGLIQPTWQGRTTPAPTDPGVAGYRFAQPGPVVNAGYRSGQK